MNSPLLSIFRYTFAKRKKSALNFVMTSSKKWCSTGAFTFLIVLLSISKKFLSSKIYCIPGNLWKANSVSIFVISKMQKLKIAMKTKLSLVIIFQKIRISINSFPDQYFWIPPFSIWSIINIVPRKFRILFLPT